MQEIAFHMQVLPGMRPRLEELARTVSGPRKKEFSEAMKRWQEKKESWYLENTSKGDSLVIYFEAKDVDKMMSDFMVSKHPFDVWLRDELSAITGMGAESAPQGEPTRQLLRVGY
jgi:hypothetical protein